jgi:hypothetical protein
MSSVSIPCGLPFLYAPPPFNTSTTSTTSCSYHSASVLFLVINCCSTHPPIMANFKQHLLEVIQVDAASLGDSLRCIFHTILFNRILGQITPKEERTTTGFAYVCLPLHAAARMCKRRASDCLVFGCRCDAITPRCNELSMTQSRVSSPPSKQPERCHTR